MNSNNYMKWAGVFFMLFAITAANAQTTPVPQLGVNSVKEVVSAMTLEEKVDIVVGRALSCPECRSRAQE